MFVYDGWNVVEVLNANAADVNASSAIVAKYTWGLDLSGQGGAAGTSGIHGAGGIGGLLAAVETGTTGSPVHWYFYDGNGNVGQTLVATNTATITTAATYEYDPYGNAVKITGGPAAAANPFRFSTKWFDTENGLYCYGYRYYDPRLGRWISRDPIAERGGINLFAFVSNRPLSRIDHLGLQVAPGCNFPGHPFNPKPQPPVVPPGKPTLPKRNSSGYDLVTSDYPTTRYYLTLLHYDVDPNVSDVGLQPVTHHIMAVEWEITVGCTPIGAKGEAPKITSTRSSTWSVSPVDFFEITTTLKVDIVALPWENGSCGGDLLGGGTVTILYYQMTLTKTVEYSSEIIVVDPGPWLSRETLLAAETFKIVVDCCRSCPGNPSTQSAK